MTWTTFASTPDPTGVELDANLAALARMGVFPCTVTGSANAIILTLADTNTPPLNAYQNYEEFVFVAGASSSSTVTIKVGSLATLQAYKDTFAGPVQISTTEIVIGCLYVATYDSTLDSSAGGFHVRAGGIFNSTAINPNSIIVGTSGATITAMLSTLATVTYTVVPANSMQVATVALSGAIVNDPVILGLPASVTSGLVFNGHVLASGSIGMRAANVTASSIAAFTVVTRVGVVRLI